nr:hypothetical protein [Tanacetum cinerariifolium]
AHSSAVPVPELAQPALGTRDAQAGVHRVRQAIGLLFLCRGRFGRQHGRVQAAQQLAGAAALAVGPQRTGQLLKLSIALA